MLTPLNNVGDYARAILERVDVPLRIAVLVASAATLPVLIAEERGSGEPWVYRTDWLIWSVFALELLLTTTAAAKRAEHLKRNWLSVLVVLFSVPSLPYWFSSIRLVRLTRLVRLARMLIVSVRGVRTLQESLGVRSLMYMATLTGLMTLTSGALLTVLEPETVGADLGNGVWWAIVTVSTVGYGDITPTTTLGRSVAVLLMMLGLGLLSTLAAAISAFFIESSSDSEMAGLRQQLDRIESRLERMEAGARSDNDPH